MIGVLDSGLGGLTVARALDEFLPDLDYIYFGDTARSPYGIKSPEMIISFSLKGVEFLIDQGARIIFLASHSISGAALSFVKEKIGIPVFDVISPAVSFSSEVTRNLKIGVLGNPTVVESKFYEKKFKDIFPEATVFSSACGLLLPVIEEGWFKKPETNMIVKKCVRPLLTRQIDTLIPACSHYPVLIKTIRRKAGKNINVINPSLTAARYFAQMLKDLPELGNTLSRKGVRKFFVSDLTIRNKKDAKILFGKNIRLQKI